MSDNRTYRVNSYSISSSGHTTGLGSTDDGEFTSWDNVVTLNTSYLRRAVQTLVACFITECYMVISTAFAAASTNTITLQTATVIDTPTTPADTIIVTFTAAATGKFSNTGRMFWDTDVWAAWLYNSDVGTNPAVHNDHGVKIESI